MSHNIARFPLFIPSLEEASSVIANGLRNDFSEVTVQSVSCPDVTSSPFCVSAPGLCGNTKLIQVGGVKNLLPLYNKEKRYDLKEIAESINCSKSLFIGAGAGPFFDVGQNCEMIANIKFSASDAPAMNGGFIAKTAQKSSSDSETHLLESHSSERFGLMGDFFICDGAGGQVLEIRAKKRLGGMDFVSAISNAMAAAWPQKAVGLGGVFAATCGRTKIHVMPDFSKTPLKDEDGVNNWLRFFPVRAPFVAYGSIVTNDPGYDIRPSHFHGCNRDTMEGGHFHIDLDPEDVDYVAYFAFAEEFIRFDQPK